MLATAALSGCGAKGGLATANEGPDGRPSAGNGGVESVVYGPEGPSCSGMTGTECQGESCCSSLLVPGGTFPMGRGTEICSDCNGGCLSGRMCESDEQPEHSATVSDFYLDKYEVTVSRFEPFVGAIVTGWRPQAGQGANVAVESAQGIARGATGWQSTWDSQLAREPGEFNHRLDCEPDYHTWTQPPQVGRVFPINCVDWFEAFAFCIWDEGRLPTEAEWEYAAAGGDQNRLYSWGSSATEPLPANYLLNHNTPFLAVGSEPSGNARWGHADLSGSMGAWILDWYRNDYYADTADGCTDCANLTEASYRVLRGWGWAESAWTNHAAERSGAWVGHHSAAIGIRCARSPSP